MTRSIRRVATVVLATVLALVALALALRRRTGERVRGIPFSRAIAWWTVGADWAARRGYAGESVTGEAEDFGVFAREGFDPDDLHPEIPRFYERTAAYDMAYTVRWHGGFRLGARLAAFLTTWLGQLNLPGRSDGHVRHLQSDLARVPESVDPRGSVVWTRVDADGEAVFVAIYATHEHEGVTYANVAVPLPGSNLSTVLRPVTIDGDDVGDGVAFTTDGPGDGGLYLITPVGPLALPLAQSFRVWPAGAPGAPDSPVAAADLVATHEMCLWGRSFLTITYGITRSAAAD